MGCLNDNEWTHKFANIHLSGPCNRRCYFCIGQHMMALDSYNTLNRRPQDMYNIDIFYDMVRDLEIKELYLTGTNTDPCLYKYHYDLVKMFKSIRGLKIGIRTNGSAHVSNLQHYDNGSLTICSMDYHTNLKMMGGPPPDIGKVSLYTDLSKWNINTVLGEDNATKKDLDLLIDAGIKYHFRWINLREPYGQEHIGDSLFYTLWGDPDYYKLENTVPVWKFDDLEICYWDVHYVGTKSINLYANGRISDYYSVTKGHEENGIVLSQDNFQGHKRRSKQWVGK